MSDRDEDLRAADEISFATRTSSLEHLSCNEEKNCGIAGRNTPDSAIRFVLTEEKLQAGINNL